eukprot:SAG22_NODE_852_length_6847_cov_14.600830_3_plen_624_part_00
MVSTDAAAGGDGSEPASEEPAGGAAVVAAQPPSEDRGSYDVPARGQRLITIFVINGGLTDRPVAVGQGRASWVGFDRGYRGRRDALARCVTAALWADAAGDATAGRQRAVHPDCACYVLYEGDADSSEHDSAAVHLLALTPDFARGLGGVPSEARILKALSDGVQARQVPGLTVWWDRGSVSAAALQAFEHAGLRPNRWAMLELHEDKARRLPVYSAGRTAPAAADGLVDDMVLVLGCVQDHLQSVAAVVAAAAKGGAAGRPPRWVTAVNVGPISEFSSKVVHTLQGHHTNGVLAAAVAAVCTADDAAASGGAITAADGGGPAAVAAPEAQVQQQREAGGAERAGERGQAQILEVHQAEDDLAGGLHFWVPCPGVAVSDLPTAEQCRGAFNPQLDPASRDKVWPVPRLVLAAFARSHGVYPRNKLTLMLDDAVLQLDGTLLRHIADRKWAALTEHHLLVALRDAIQARSARLAPAAGFKAAFEAAAVAGDKLPVLALVLDSGAAAADAAGVPALPVYEPAVQQQELRPGSPPDDNRVMHVVLAAPGQGVQMRADIEAAAGHGAMLCSLPTGLPAASESAQQLRPIDDARAIVSVQGHHNEGRLVAAHQSLLTRAALLGEADEH